MGAFSEEARLRIAAAHAEVQNAEPDPGGDLLAEKTWTFCGYELDIQSSDGARSLCGELVRDNGYKSAKPSRWLHTVGMKVHEWVDRSLCGEYQLFADLLSKLSEEIDLRTREARAAISGRVQVFVLSTPCLSCVSIFRQFQVLLPRVALTISIGSRAYVVQR